MLLAEFQDAAGIILGGVAPIHVEDALYIEKRPLDPHAQASHVVICQTMDGIPKEVHLLASWHQELLQKKAASLSQSYEAIRCRDCCMSNVYADAKDA